MGAYSDKLRRRDFNIPRRGFYKTERERKQRRPAGTEKVQPAEKRAGKARVSSPKARRAAQLRVTAPVSAVSAKLHHEAESRNQDENSAVTAVNSGMAAAENAAVLAVDHHYGAKLKNSRSEDIVLKESSAGTPGDKLSFFDGTKDGMSVNAGQTAFTGNANSADSDAAGGSVSGAGNKSPDAGSNPLSRFRQRQNMKHGYAAAARGEAAREGSIYAAGAAENAAKESTSLLQRITGSFKNAFSDAGRFVADHFPAFLTAGVLALVLAAVIGGASSCSMMIGGSGNSVVATSYTAEDEDILGTEEDYRELESDLRDQISEMESEMPDYDEYRYFLDEIGHNPYELASVLTILFEDYRRNDREVQDMLQALFEAQYELILDPVTEIRTREVEKTGTREVLNEETGETETEEYTYTETEEYEYRIMNVTLINHQLRKVIEDLDLPEDHMQRYEIILALKGNRAYLFGDDIYANIDADADGTPQNPYLDYRVPGEALTDLQFARMLEVAKRYLDHPYVWGGSTFNEGFDCSGYVCWVINESGAGHIGRTTAEGLRQWTAPIDASERKPGDIVYFEKTYNTPGASHVGIYVGGGMMIHCGNPCKFSNIDSGYFANHLMGYGRIPEE